MRAPPYSSGSAKLRAAYAGLMAILAAAVAQGQSPAPRGEVLFENRCARCHGLGGDGSDGLAPALIGVVGRPVAGRADYVYSDALKAKGGVWSPEAINRYLIDPQAFAQGSDMEASAPDPAEREAIIAYLARLR